MDARRHTTKWNDGIRAHRDALSVVLYCADGDAFMRVIQRAHERATGLYRRSTADVSGAVLG